MGETSSPFLSTIASLIPKVMVKVTKNIKIRYFSEHPGCVSQINTPCFLPAIVCVFNILFCCFVHSRQTNPLLRTQYCVGTLL